jgi:hypothetical protein
MGYLVFQLWSHAQIYQDDAPDVVKTTEYQLLARRRTEKEKAAVQMIIRTELESAGQIVARTMSPQDHILSTTAVVSNGSTPEQPAIAMNPGQCEETGSTEVVEKPQMSLLVTLALLVIVTAVGI